MIPVEYRIPYIDSYPDEVFIPISSDLIARIKPWYLISNYGKVFSLKSNRLLKPTISNSGYLVVTLRTYDEIGVTTQIHRIEMLSFMYQPGCENLDIDHLDCNKFNNDLCNLEWVTKAENTRRAALNGLLLTGEDAPWTKVSDEKVHEICNLYIAGYSLSAISRIVDCGMDSVFRIVHGIGRTNISSQYDIESRYRGILTDSQIHKACSIISSNRDMPYRLIKFSIFKALGIPVSKKVDSIFRNLYRHDPYCFYEISSQYDY